MPVTKDHLEKAQSTGELDEYVRSMRAYLDKNGNDRPGSPEFCWKELSVNSQRYNNVNLASKNWSKSSSSASPKENYSK